MSVEQHRNEAGQSALVAHVVVVSSTRTVAEDGSGKVIATLLEQHGHQVGSRVVVDDDIAAIRRRVEQLAAADAEVVVLTGGTGLTGRDLTPEALEPLFTRTLDGFGELFRWLSYQEIGAAAMLSRAVGGLVGRTLVLALPGSTAACRLAMEKLVLPELRHLVHLSRKDRAPGHAAPVDDDWAVDDPSVIDGEPVGVPPRDEPTLEAEFEEETDALPPPTGTLGRLGGPGRLEIGLSAPEDERPPDPGAPARSGWQRAVYDLGGEVRHDLREELPPALEKFAPVVNVLEQAGESGVLILPSGVRYSLWGFPDLRRPGSKVLAVGWGSPLAEILALHRHPTPTGACIDERHGLLPHRDRAAGPVAEQITGRPPPGTTGSLVAVTGDAVWFERDGRVVRWDGQREREDGSVKQALASLVLDWSQR